MTKENQLKKLIIDLEDFEETTDFREEKYEEFRQAIDLIKGCEYFVEED